MGREGKLLSILRFLRTVVLVDLGIFVAVGLVCWFGGWRTVYQYGNGLRLAGTLAIGLGFLSLVSNWQTPHGFGYQYNRSVSGQSLQGRRGQTVIEFAQNLKLLIQMVIIGILSIAVGTLIQSL